jgi:hypothetical protein
VSLPIITDPSPCALAAVNLPPGLSIDSNTGVISGTIAYGDAELYGGVYIPTILASDSGGTSMTTFEWDITPTPETPTIAPIPNQTSAAGLTESLLVHASTPNGEPFSYTATGLPSGLSIDSNTGLISGTIDLTAASPTPYIVTVTADAGSGHSASQTFDWTVTATNLPPTLTNPGNQVSAAGDSVSLPLTASDPDGDSLTYTATGLPAGLTIDPSSGTISGTLANAAASTTPYTVTVAASDGISSTSQTFQWTVNYVGVNNPGSQSNTDGEEVSLPITGVDAGGGTLTYSAMGLPPGLSINGSTGLISGTLSSTADSASPYTTTITASDGTFNGSTTFTWTVTPITLANPGDQYGREGNSVTLPLSASAAPGDSLTYSAAGLPAGLSINSTSGLISGTLAPGSASVSADTVVVTASDGTHSASQTFNWNVQPAILLLSPGPQGDAPGDQVTLPVTASTNRLLPLTFSATGLPAGLSINPSTGWISGVVSAGAAQVTPYSVTVTATDGTYTGSITFTWIVSSVFVPSPGDQSNTVGDNITLPIAGVDHDGDALQYSAVGLPPGLNIDSGTGIISGTITAGADGASPYTVTVSASDGTTRSTNTFTWNVTALSLTDPGNQDGVEGSNVALQLLTQAPAGDTLQYSATGLPNGLSLNLTTGLISGTLAPGDAAGSPDSVTVTVSDGNNNAQQTFTWTVEPVIALTNPGGQSNADGDTISLALSASDADNGTLSYSATGLPSGLSINGDTGLISGTIGSTADSSSPYTVTVSASDGTNSSSQTFPWLVSHVFLANPGDQANTDGDSVNLAATARDNDQDTLTYSAAGLPPGLSINSSTGAVSGAVSSTADTSSPYSVTLTASDGTSSSSVTFLWKVTALSLANPGPQSNMNGSMVSLPLSVNNPSGGALTYAATGLPPGLSINPNTGVIGGTLAPQADTGSPYSATVAVADGSGHTASQTFVWTVTPVVSLAGPPTQSNATGDRVSLALSANDANHNPLTFSASGLPSGLSIDSSTGVISGTISSMAATGSPYLVTVTASDGTYSSTQTFAWQVSQVLVSNPNAQTNSVGDTVSLPISARDNQSGTLTYTATGLPSGLSIDSGSGLIAGAIGTTANTGSPYRVTVTVSDGTASSSQTFAWTVNGPLTLANPGDQTNSDGDTISLPLAIVDPTSAPLSYTATDLPPGLSLGSDGIITGTISSTADSGSPYSVTVTVSAGTTQVSQSFTWTINPVSLANPGGQTNVEGDSVSLQMTGADGAGDTLSYSAAGLPAGLSINATTGLISGTLSAGAASTHPYNVTVTASAGSNNASQTFQWTVSPLVILSNPGPQNNADGDSVSVALSAQDARQQTLSYSAAGLPPGLSINALTGVISGTLSSTADNGSPYQVTVTASDGAYSASKTFSWTVTHLALTNPGTQNSAAGTAVSLQLAGRGGTGGTLTYSATGLPPGLSINSSGLISGTVSSTADGSSPYTTTVTVSDGTNQASQTCPWIVRPQITLTDPGDQSNNNVDSVSLAVPATDATGQTLTYSAANLPPGLSIDSSTGLISGTISNAADANNPYLVTVTATDGTASASQSFNWTINQTVSFTAPGDQSNIDGDSVSLPVSASDPNGAPLTYSSSGLPPGLSIDSATGLISGTISDSADTGSPYAVTVTATDGTSTASTTFNWTVTAFALPNPGPKTNNEGDSISLSLATQEADGATLTYSAIGLPTGLSMDSGSGLITGTPAAGSAANSPYLVTVTASDGVNSVSQAFSWTVSSIQLATPSEQTSTDGQNVLLAIAALDTAGGTLTYSAANLPPGLSIDAHTGLISGSLSANADTNSPYWVTVTASDGTDTTSVTFAWAVTAAPTITLNDLGDQTNVVGDVVSVPVPADNPSGTQLTYSATSLPSGLSIDAQTGWITGTIGSSADSNSPYAVTVTASDGTHQATATFAWTVARLSLTNPGAQSNGAGSTVSLALSADDGQSNPVTYSANGLPPGLSINTSTGLISGTLSSGLSAVASYVVTVTAADGNASTSQTFTWTVTTVGLDTPADQTNTEGDVVSLPLAGSDATSAALTYSASGLPPGLSLDSATGVISGTISAGAAAAGPYTVTVAASDGTASTSQTFTWTVNPYVTVNAVSDQSNVEGDVVVLPVQARDPAQDTLRYSAQGLPAGLSINSSTGLITGTVAQGASQNGPYTVTLTAGNGRYSASQTFTWKVTPANVPVPVLSNPGSQSAVTGQAVSLALQATDPGGYPLTFSASGLPDGLSIDPTTGVISGTLADDAASDTPYAVTVTVNNGVGGTASQSFSWQVGAGSGSNPGGSDGIVDGIPYSTGFSPPVSGSPAPFTLQGGFTLGAVEAVLFAPPYETFTLATFTDNGSAFRDPGDYSVTINWGDGTSSDGWVSEDAAGQFSVFGQHGYALHGAYAATVTVTRVDGAAAATTSTVKVGDIYVGFPSILCIYSFTDHDGDPTNSTNFSATITWGDGTTTPATIPALSVVQGVHTYSTDSNPGSAFQVSTNITDLTDGSTLVGGGPPGLIRVSRPPLGAYGNEFSFTPGVALNNVDVATFILPEGVDSASEFSAKIDWGDGTGLDSNTVIEGGGGVFQVLGSHTYAALGLYPIKVYISQGWGGQAPVALPVALAAQVNPLSLEVHSVHAPILGNNGAFLWPVTFQVNGGNPNTNVGGARGTIVQEVEICSSATYAARTNVHPEYAKAEALDYLEAWMVPTKKNQPIPTPPPGNWSTPEVNLAFTRDQVRAINATRGNDFYFVRPIGGATSEGVLSMTGTVYYFEGLGLQDLTDKTKYGFHIGATTPGKSSPAGGLLYNPDTSVLEQLLSRFRHTPPVQHTLALDWYYSRGQAAPGKKVHFTVVEQMPTA